MSESATTPVPRLPSEIMIDLNRALWRLEVIREAAERENNPVTADAAEVESLFRRVSELNAEASVSIRHHVTPALESFKDAVHSIAEAFKLHPLQESQKETEQ